MARGLNKVQLIGNLGQDPDLRYTGAGTAVCNLRMAVNDTYVNQQGEEVDNTEWVNVVAWAKLGEIVNEHLEKGSRLYVEGELETRSWEDDHGNTRYTTQVNADEVLFLGGGSGGGRDQSGSSSGAHGQQSPPPSSQEQDEEETFEPDDELPF